MKPNKRRFATDDEKEALKALHGVRFLPGSWDKRFIRQLNETFHLLPEGSISDVEAPQLWRILIKYRAQVRHKDKDLLLKIAETHAAPDFRKQAAAAREQAEIDRQKEKYKEAMKK